MTEPTPNHEIPAGDAQDALTTGRSRRRKWLFRVMALSLPVVLLLLVEGVFRLNGYGGRAPILAEVGQADGQAYIATISRGIEPFFVGGGPRGSIEYEVFTMPKPAGVVRIFLAGGSAMQGYPQPRNLKLAAFLEAMLRDVWPGRQVEVINLGTTAVASFPAACIAEAALAYDPDLIVVYSGNNEFFGAGGVASVHGLGQSASAMRLLHQLRRSALVQRVMEARSGSAAALDSGENLMDAVVADATILPDDPRRATAAENLEANLRHVQTRCAARGVPLVVCTCPAMERNLAPIGKDAPIPLDSVAAEAFNQTVAEARALAASEPEAALAKYDAALSQWVEHARLHFERGECLAALGRMPEAAEAFVRAKDLDTMPWRPPSSSNEAIRRAAADDVVLCDLEKTFRAASPEGVIDWTLMDDHVHPSLQGQYLVARSIMESMTALSGDLHVDESALTGLASWNEYAERLGANELDAYRVLVRLSDLFNRSFFKATNPAALERVTAALGQAEARMDPLERSVVDSLQRAHRGRPITGEVGEALLLAGRNREAAKLLAIGRRAARPLNIPRLRYGCEAVIARRAAGDQVPPADVAELVREGEVMLQVADDNSPYVYAWLGCAYHLAGREADALAKLERGMTTTPLVGQPVLQEVLAKTRAAVRGTEGN